MQKVTKRKTSNIHLAEELILRNTGNRYDALIERAKNNGYHDFKFDTVPGHPEYADCTCPKTQLVQDLDAFPELSDLRTRVMQGEFDDVADETDKDRMRNNLKQDGSYEVLKDILGL